MEAGSRVWVKDKVGDQAWIIGTVVSRKAGKISVEVDADVSEKLITYAVNEDDGIELSDVKLANEEEMDTVDDLIQLPHLHEAAILHSLTQRFELGLIYTFTANAILLAVNPFKRLPLYGLQLLQEYYTEGVMRQQGIDAVGRLAPHVFAIADSAYRDMMQGIHAGSSGASMGPINQSILISGESGAGKTESTKVVMKYLTTVGNANGITELEEGSVMDRVLQSNPILEAFGNARTIRNDNSSRFGKFIELLFDKRGLLLGAKIKTYLLEKVRIPNQSANERNFHIFYQMTKGADDDERAKWALEGPEEYKYTNQGDCYDLTRMEDEEEFVFTKKALHLMGFSIEDQESIFALVASLLHLGQIEFETGADGCAQFSSDRDCQASLDHVCRLACLPREGLERALTERPLEVGAKSVHEVHTIKLEERQAIDAKDALAKAIYGQLFNHIVAALNENINCARKDVRASVGVLDIFGFECFKRNSFEQLCINYTNETLQQQFNQFVFKMEQKEYTKEGIEWSFVEFPDNQDCLDLLEGRPEGLLAMLDDECRMGVRGTDKNYASRLYKTHAATERIFADSALQRELKFALRHYAGEVIYSVESFLDKNKDELPKASNELFASSSSAFLRELFTPVDKKKKEPSSKSRIDSKRQSVGGDSNVKKPTVGMQFKEQLHNLMDMIRDTRPHYIRCVKPNDLAKPDTIHRPRVMEQLRYGGVLEAVRVARSGFPVRLPHKEFYLRYRPLVALMSEVGPNPLKGSLLKAMLKKFPMHLRSETADSARKRCEELVKSVLALVILDAKNIPADTMQFGKTKVFLRKNAYDTLEALRSKRMVDSAVYIQAIVRGYLYWKVYRCQRAAVITLQCFVRVSIAKSKMRKLRCERAATLFQCAVRCGIARKKYIRLCRSVLTLQSCYRGGMARIVFNLMRRNTKAIVIQRWGRKFPKRRLFVRLKGAALALQCAVRMRKAKQVLKKLRAEAKDVGNLKRDNEKLKAEMAMLKENARRASMEREAANAAAAALAAQKAAAEMAETLQGEAIMLRDRVVELEAKNLQEYQDSKELQNRVSELELQLQEWKQTSSSAQQEVSVARQEALVAREEALSAQAQALAAREEAKAAQLEADLAREEARLSKEALIEAANKPPQIIIQEKIIHATIPVDDTSCGSHLVVPPQQIPTLIMSDSSIVTSELTPRDGVDHEAAAAAELEVAILRGQVSELKALLEQSQEACRAAEAAALSVAAAASIAAADVHSRDSSKNHNGMDGTATPPALWDAAGDVEVLSEDEKTIAELNEKLKEERAKRNALEAEKASLIEQATRAKEELNVLRASAEAAASAAAASAAASESRAKREDRVLRIQIDDAVISGSKKTPPTLSRSNSGRMHVPSGIGSPRSPPGRVHRVKSARSSSATMNSSVDLINHGVIPALAQLERQAYQQDTMDEFEDRLASIKRGLTSGVDVTVWDGRNKKVDAVLKLEEYDPMSGERRTDECPYPRLAFTLRGSYLLWRTNIKPVAIDTFLMVQQGAKAVPEIGEQLDPYCITLLHQPNGIRDPERIIVLRVGGEDARRDLYSAVRKLLTEATLRPRTPRAVSMLGPPPQYITALEHDDSTVSLSGSTYATVRAQAEQIEMLRIELSEQSEGYERITLQMMEMTNDLNKKEDESKALNRKLAAAIAEMSEIKIEYASYKEVTAKFIRRIDMLQCEVDELIEENNVLKQTMRRHYHGSGSGGQASPYTGSFRTGSARSTPHTHYSSTFNTPSPR